MAAKDYQREIYLAFWHHVLEPGAIRFGDGRAVDVRKLDDMAGYLLQALDNRENDFLAELEITPLDCDNIGELILRNSDRLQRQNARQKRAAAQARRKGS